MRNLPDGRVEAVLEGEESAVKNLVDYCRHGPSSARVDTIELNYEHYKGEFSDFDTFQKCYAFFFGTLKCESFPALMYSPPIPRTAEAILAKFSEPKNCLGLMIM